MRLDHTASVPARSDDVWRFVNDVPAVVDCLPGARLTESVDESTYHGQVRISVGPWSLAYQGSLVVVDRDDDLRTLRMDASGRDRRGGGSAHAAITLTVEPDGTTATIRGRADVALTGPVASLSGLARAMSSRLFEQFAGEMSDVLAQGPAGPTGQADRRRDSRRDPRMDSVQVAPLLWSVTRQRVAGYLRGLGRRQT
jgi:carbon monoxide dehydrogenase subunit G